MKPNRHLLILTFLLLVGSLQARQATTAREWIRTELYFGRSVPTGGKVSNAAWRKFVKTYITPAFPDGSTVIDGDGQWLDSKTGKTISERSKVLIVLYEVKDKAEKDKALKVIADAYIKQFRQQSVMRVDQSASAVFYPIE